MQLCFVILFSFNQFAYMSSKSLPNLIYNNEKYFLLLNENNSYNINKVSINTLKNKSKTFWFDNNLHIKW